MQTLASALRLIAILIVLGCLWVQDAPAIDCDTVPPPAPRYLDSLGVFQFEGGGAGCWGYTAPDGTQYALMGAQSGVGIVNVTTMQYVDMVPAEPCIWRELKTYRHYCYAVSECYGLNEGLMIIDLQFLPDSVHYVGSYSDFGKVTSHCISIDTARGFCYLVREDYSGFRIVDLANPESPVDVGGVTTGELHDMTAFNDTVYAAEGFNSAFSIWNCSNKINPVFLSRVTIPGNGYVHNLWPTPDRRFLVSTEEIPTFRTVKIWNMEDLDNISLVDEYIGLGGVPHNAHVEGNYLYIAHYSSGVSVLDITTPECAEEVAVFDTWVPNNVPQYIGCWGVYPHTGASGLVYASSMDGRLFIFRSKAVWADFAGTPVLGQAPLAVSFSDSSLDALSWNWQFGDGDSSSVQNPVHVFGPGLYSVELSIVTPFAEGSELKSNYVTALAETLKVADTMATPAQSIVWEIRHQNNVPIAEISIPIQLSNVPAVAQFDSVSTVGCRTAYFESKQYMLSQFGVGKVVLRLEADDGGGSPPLAPGEGPIARVHFTIKSTATTGQEVVLTMPPLGISQHTLSARTLTTTYAPALIGGTTAVVCECPCHGDPMCDGVHDILDVVETIGHAFQNATPVLNRYCPTARRSDYDCSGSVDVVDVVLIVNVAFRNADPQTVICAPCDL